MSILAARWRCLRSPFLLPLTQRLASSPQLHSCRSQILWNGLATHPRKKKKNKSQGPSPPKLANFLKESLKKAPPNSNSKRNVKKSKAPLIIIPTRTAQKKAKKDGVSAQFWTEDWGEDSAYTPPRIAASPQLSFPELKPPPGAEAGFLRMAHASDEANTEPSDSSCLEYTRRIEGLIDSAGSSVLLGWSSYFPSLPKKTDQA